MHDSVQGKACLLDLDDQFDKRERGRALQRYTHPMGRTASNKRRLGKAPQQQIDLRHASTAT